jgi:hypothetical protein
MSTVDKRKRKPVVKVEERVTRAEEQLTAHSRRSDEHHEAVLSAIRALTEETRERLELHDARLVTVETKFSKYEGMWGFVTIILSSVAAAWAVFGGFIKRRLGFD